jgi:hypothetical protein
MAFHEKLGLSQSLFASLMGISPRALLLVAESHPQAVLEALHR